MCSAVEWLAVDFNKTQKLLISLKLTYKNVIHKSFLYITVSPTFH
jgi:hypothetical protein